MDERLATHFAHLFIRDPLVVFSEDLKQLDLDKTDHFENLQSTNWQHMRFKPPPHDKDTGWRVEFRPMEIQLTDFENAAFSIFLVLITRAILSFDLNFYIPIARVTENMEAAHRRDAVLDQRFHFRKDPLPPRPHKHAINGGGGSSSSGDLASLSGTSTPHATGFVSRPPSPPLGPVEDEYQLMTIDEIINGQQPQRPSSSSVPATAAAASTAGGGGGDDDGFPGLIPLVEMYLDSVNVDVETRCELARYLDFIRKRASGRLWTAAKWIRHFVRTHADYRHDSVVTEAICYDLVKAVERVAACSEHGYGEQDGDNDNNNNDDVDNDANDGFRELVKKML
jgi:glutamate--cysteine ligase catalytic subunit